MMKMEIQIDLRLKTIGEMEAIEPVLMLGKIYTANTMKTEEPQEWHYPLRAKTVMGVEGSTCMCTTVLRDYFERDIYRIIRMAYDL